MLIHRLIFVSLINFSEVETDLMFTDDELASMNGAKMVPNLKSRLQEELEKRVTDQIIFESFIISHLVHLIE